MVSSATASNQCFRFHKDNGSLGTNHPIITTTALFCIGLSVIAFSLAATGALGDKCYPYLLGVGGASATLGCGSISLACIFHRFSKKIIPLKVEVASQQSTKPQQSQSSQCPEKSETNSLIDLYTEQNKTTLRHEIFSFLPAFDLWKNADYFSTNDQIDKIYAERAEQYGYKTERAKQHGYKETDKWKHVKNFVEIIVKFENEPKPLYLRKKWIDFESILENLNFNKTLQKQFTHICHYTLGYDTTSPYGISISIKEIIETCLLFGFEPNHETLDTNENPVPLPFHYACKYGHTEVVELLLKWGVDPNHEDQRDINYDALAYPITYRCPKLPLQIAIVQCTSKRILPLLLQHDANPSLRDVSGKNKTSLEFAEGLYLEDESWVSLKRDIHLMKQHMQDNSPVNPS